MRNPIVFNLLLVLAVCSVGVEVTPVKCHAELGETRCPGSVSTSIPLVLQANVPAGSPSRGGDVMV